MHTRALHSKPAQPEDFAEIRLAVLEPGAEVIPLGMSPVSAGFPSPAEDYAEGGLNVHSYLVRNPVATFFFPVRGDSMQGAGILDGDILVVDRSVTPVDGHIVVAFVQDERLVKRLRLRAGRMTLLAENPAYPPLPITEDTEHVLWGVVVGKFKRLPG